MTANGLLLQDGEVWVEDDGQQVPRVFSTPLVLGVVVVLLGVVIKRSVCWVEAGVHDHGQSN